MGEKYNIMCDIVNMDFEEKIGLLLERLNIISPFKDKELIEKKKIIDETLKSGSTAANPKQIKQKDVEFILKEIF